MCSFEGLQLIVFLSAFIIEQGWLHLVPYMLLLPVHFFFLLPYLEAALSDSFLPTLICGSLSIWSAEADSEESSSTACKHKGLKSGAYEWHLWLVCIAMATLVSPTIHFQNTILYLSICETRWGDWETHKTLNKISQHSCPREFEILLVLPCFQNLCNQVQHLDPVGHNLIPLLEIPNTLQFLLELPPN